MMRPSAAAFRFALAACTLALGAATRAQSSVIVVDSHLPPPAGVDFSQISAAIHAAAGGEIILVHAGSYSAFTVDGKSLTLVADGAVTVNGSITIRSLTADQPVVLRGFSSKGKATEAGLRIDGCAGPVWVESCAPTGGNFGDNPDGIYASSSLAVTLVRCDIQGGGGIGGSMFQSPSGSAGLRLRTCLATAWDVTSRGGDGWGAQDNGGSGGAGVLLWPGAHLESSGGVFTGGFGMGGWEDWDTLCGCYFCWGAGVGGAGLQTTSDGGCSASVRDSELQAGIGVFNPDGFCTGADGVDLNDPLQLVTFLQGESRGLQLNAPVREGETLHLSLLGEAGDAALVLASFEAGFVPLSYGTLALAPTIVAVIGALPPSGDLAIDSVVPELGPGVEGLILVAQPLFQPAGGGKVLGAPSATVLLDAQF